MSLVATAAVLALAIDVAGGILDPPGILKSGGLALAIATWMVSNTIAGNVPIAGTMTAAGSAVSGNGTLDFTADGDDFGQHLADSIPAVDPQGILKWKAIGRALVDHMKAHGQINPSGYVANPAGGAVTGTGTIGFSTVIFSPTLSSVLGISDTVGVLVWAALGAAILAYIGANASVNATGFTSPTGGGPLVGVSTIG